MKFLKTLLVGAMVVASTFCVNAQSLSDILGSITKNSGGNSSGNIISNLIEGVFTKTNLTLQDLVGDYQAQGPAVTFKSENFLQKAGGIAGAAAIESKINPYYEKYGLNNMSLSVDENANFVMKIKSMSLKGTITKNESDGTFEFNFKVLGINLGKFTAYIEKSGSNLNLMFDANKLKSFISTIAKLTGNSMASALGLILDSYDGACIGWKMVNVSAPTQSTTTPETTSPAENIQEQEPDANSSQGIGNKISNGLNLLKGILK